jgi:hypothetical protein
MPGRRISDQRSPSKERPEAVALRETAVHGHVVKGILA